MKKDKHITEIRITRDVTNIVITPSDIPIPPKPKTKPDEFKEWVWTGAEWTQEYKN